MEAWSFLASKMTTNIVLITGQIHSRYFQVIWGVLDLRDEQTEIKFLLTDNLPLWWAPWWTTATRSRSRWVELKNPMSPFHKWIHHDPWLQRTICTVKKSWFATSPMSSQVNMDNYYTAFCSSFGDWQPQCCEKESSPFVFHGISHRVLEWQIITEFTYLGELFL